MVDDNERYPKTRAECHDLLANSITKGDGTMRVLVHEFGHGSIHDDVAGLFEELLIHISKKGGVDI